MEPIKFKEAYDKQLGAGDNPNTGDLHFVRAIDTNAPDRVFLISCWKPNAEELARIIATGEVYIGLMANPTYPTQPPVSVMGLNPFAKEGDELHGQYANPFIVIAEGAPIPVTPEFFKYVEAGGSVAGLVADDKIFAEAIAERVARNAAEKTKTAEETLQALTEVAKKREGAELCEANIMTPFNVLHPTDGSVKVQPYFRENPEGFVLEKIVTMHDEISHVVGSVYYELGVIQAKALTNFRELTS